MRKLKGNIFTDKYIFVPGEITIEGDTISELKYPMSIPDADKDKYIIPGLVDIHSHGCVGCDTSDADSAGLKKMLDYELKCGITSYMPTTMTFGEDILTDIVKSVSRLDSPVIKGIYLEGPFISREKKGAQNENYIIPPDIDMLRRLNRASKGLIRIVAIAPECENAIECIRAGRDEFRFSIAHTACDHDMAKKAIEAGAKHVTHLFNAMNGYDHRAPGVIGAAADDEDTMVELICDGVHIHDTVIRNSFKLFGAGRIVLISDSMRAAGMPDGVYSLGGQTVYVRDKKACLEDGTIAGSVSNLMDCLRHCIDIGIRPEDAIRAATENPARAAGIFDRTGSIERGKLSELLVLDRDLGLKEVIVNDIR